MTTATLPRSAQILTGTQRPTLAQIRLLRRISVQDVEEHRKLAATLQDGLSGIKEDAKVRKGILAFALGHFSDAEEVFEAFDEDWKGNPSDPLGAEKHWGLFTVNRQPNQIMKR